jgi:hypothetical protein
MALSASYLGIDIPSLPSGAPYCALSDGGSVPRISPPGERRRHIPRPIAALVAVYMIVVGEVPPVIWIIGIGFWWTFGILLQLAAGTAARLAQFTTSLVKSLRTA